jgi:hypothetical protein
MHSPAAGSAIAWSETERRTRLSVRLRQRLPIGGFRATGEGIGRQRLSVSVRQRLTDGFEMEVSRGGLCLRWVTPGFIMTPVWPRHREFWLQMWLKRPALWVLSQGLIFAVVFAAIGLATSTPWTPRRVHLGGCDGRQRVWPVVAWPTSDR